MTLPDGWTKQSAIDDPDLLRREHALARWRGAALAQELTLKDDGTIIAPGAVPIELLPDVVSEWLYSLGKDRVTHEQHVECLARELHESGRALGPGHLFYNWDQIEEARREEHRMQARYLIEQGFVDLVVLERTILTSAGTKQRCPDHPESNPRLARVASTTRGAWVCLRCARVLERVENVAEPPWLKDTVG